MKYKSNFVRNLGLSLLVSGLVYCSCGPKYVAKPPMGNDTITGARADSIASQYGKILEPVNPDSVRMYPVPN